MDNAEKQSLWHLCTFENIGGLNFELPIAGCASADCHDLAVLFQASARPSQDGLPGHATVEAHTHLLLASVLGMHFKPIERNEPFGPMVAWANGRRSAIPADFLGDQAVLIHLAGRAINPVLKARLADLCWLFDRRQWRCGLSAIGAYTDIVRAVDAGELRYRRDASASVFSRESCDYLRRAAHIARAVNWSSEEAVALRKVATELRRRAATEGDLHELFSHCELDVDAGISADACEVALAIEGALAGDSLSKANPHLVVELWRLAARAYNASKKGDDCRRCLSEAAERLAAQAETASVASPLLAAGFFASAISQLAGLPDKKERRRNLRHQLIDVQSRVADEMASIIHPIDLKDIVELTQARMAKPGLLDKFFVFACLESSPKPEALFLNAAEMVRKHPLSSLFASQQLDRDGKVIHRIEGATVGEADGAILRGQVAQAEGIRRQVIATASIEVARNAIVSEHYLSHHALLWLMRCSPSVPVELDATFALGFTRFFQGDFVGATYILTPLLEAMLRHVLKSYGHDVTTFDEVLQTQEDRTITSLFDNMRTELDSVFGSPTTTDISNVFLDKQGPHLRHALSHGLLSDSGPFGADAVYGCWLIFRLAVLPLIAYRDQLDVPADWLETL